MKDFVDSNLQAMLGVVAFIVVGLLFFASFFVYPIIVIGLIVYYYLVLPIIKLIKQELYDIKN